MMADQARSAPAPGGPTEVRSCWMCGIRLAAHHMVADGGSACADVRWYCLDTRGCTERWTSRRAGRGDVRHGARRQAGAGIAAFYAADLARGSSMRSRRLWSPVFRRMRCTCVAAVAGEM